MHPRSIPSAALLLGGALLASSGACTGAAPVASAPSPDRVQVGYGSLDAGAVTGSISSLTQEQIGPMAAGRIEEVLRDNVPGLDVRRDRNGDYSIRIRGARSLIGGNEPLVVIDGMPASGKNAMMALSLLSPQTVARIDVLKDAGSLAAFGSRGMNGVILVTTRRGR